MARRFVTLLEADLPKTLIGGWVGPRTTFLLRVEGPCGVDQIRRIIEQLQRQTEWVEEDPPSPTL